MPTAYTGNPANFARTPTVNTSLPADGDPGNAASVGTPFQKLLDYVAWLQANAAGRSETNTFTQAQTFNAIASYLANIGLTGTALQSILKSGTGGLDVGTSIASDVRILLGNVAKWTAQASTGNLVSAGGTVTGLPAPVNTTDAATKAYVDGLPTRANTFTAAQTFNGAVNVPTPVDANDAASKGYVDGLPARANTFTAAQTFTGSVTVPTPLANTDAATRLFVRQSVGELVLSNWGAPVTSPVANLQDVASGRPRFPGSGGYNYGYWCAVGNSGGIAHSTDNARSWASATSGTTNGLVAVRYGADRYCAVGAAGTIITSPTYTAAGAWSVRTSQTSSDLKGITYNGWGGTWCAVGLAGTIRTSSTNDGLAWTPQTSGTSAALQAVAANSSGHFCAVGDAGTILLSTNNGVTWTPATNPPNTPFLAVEWADNGFWVAASASGTWRSSDGLTWTVAGSSTGIVKLGATGAHLVGVTSNGIWVASRDGASWDTYLDASNSTAPGGVTATEGSLGMVVTVNGNQVRYTTLNFDP